MIPNLTTAAAFVSNGLAGWMFPHPTPRPRGVQIFTSWNFEKEVDQIPAAPNKKRKNLLLLLTRGGVARVDV